MTSRETAQEAAAWLVSVRARRYSLRRLWQAPVFVLGLLAVVGVCVARPLWNDGGLRQYDRELAVLRAQLNRPGADLKPLLLRTEAALDRAALFPQRAGGAHFLLGSVYVGLAEREANGDDYWRQARTHLEQAERLGPAERDRARLAYLLGKTGHRLRLEPERIIACLSGSIDSAGDRTEGYGMLADAYLRLPKPNLHAALEANQKQLGGDELDEAVLAGPRLLRAELLLKLDETEEARKVLKHLLDKSDTNTPASVRGAARRLLATTYQDEGAWQEALEQWEEMLAVAQGPAERARAFYNLGLCNRKLNRAEDAIKNWEAARLSGGEEAQAAALALAQLQLALHPEQQSAIVDAFHSAVRHLRGPGDYRNSLVDLAAARAMFEGACKIFRESGAYEESQRLARIYERLAPPGRSQELVAWSAEACAQDLLRQAKQAASENDAIEKEQSARAQWRKAAAAYETAARQTAEPAQQADWLWRGADLYLQGQDPGKALSALERFVALPRVSPERLGEAWYKIGEAHRGLKHDMSAGAAYRRCIEYASPFAYRARYQLAQAQIERQDYDEAETHLLQNLQLMQAAPDPEAHENTLYTLAALLFQRAQYRSAAQRLQEALERYPANPNALVARFQYAKACRFLADQEAQQLGFGDPATPDARNHYQRQARKWLELAAINFLKIADDLGARQGAARLTAAEDSLLRQALFAVADCRFAQGQFDEALRQYEVLAGRFHHQVDGLIALWHVWRCSWAKSQPEKARSTHARISQMVKEMDAAAFDGASEVRTRQWWETWLSKNGQ